MSHDIAQVNGLNAFAYVGAAAWHVLGQQLQPGATMEQWAQASGLNFEVLRAVVEYHAGEFGMRADSENHVLYRSDTGARVGIVSDGYKIVQPAECLEFFREFCEAEHLQMETAGVLAEGSIYWALAKTGREANFGKAGALDVINQYVLLSTSADGSRATDASINSTRVVCRNTLRASDRTAKGRVRTRHSTTFDANATAAALGLVDLDASWQQFSADMRAMQEIAVSPEMATAYFSDLLRPAGTRAAPRADMGAQDFASLLGAPINVAQETIATDKSPRAIRGLADLEQSYLMAPGAVPGTAYGLLQGVTHYVDHVRGKDDSKRMASAWFGQGDTLKSNAYARALSLGK